MPVSNSFGYQSPNQYYDNTDPASLYDAQGNLKSNVGDKAAETAVYNVAEKIPIYGQAVAIAHGISNAARATNTAAGDAVGGAIDPASQAFQDWGNLKGTSSRNKARGAFEGIGDILGGPLAAGIDSVIKGNERREAENRYRSQQNYYKNAGYDYALNSNGISYSQNNRPVNSTNQPNQKPGAQAAFAGLGAAGGDLMKQLLARTQKPTPPTGPTASPFSTGNTFGNIDTTGAGTTDWRGQGIENVPPSYYQDSSPQQNPNGGITGGETDGTQGNPPNTDKSGFNLGGDVSGGIGGLLGGDEGGGVADMAGMFFKEGGVAHVIGGEGKDDIALVHEKTGKDTGVRVEKGEMIVFSDENVKALNDAVSSGDKDRAFALIADQLSKKGKKTGTMNYADGGTGTTTGDVPKGEGFYFTKNNDDFFLDKSTGKVYKIHPKGSTYVNDNGEEVKADKEVNPEYTGVKATKKTDNAGISGTGGKDFYNLPDGSAVDEEGQTYKQGQYGWIKDAKAQPVAPTSTATHPVIPANSIAGQTLLNSAPHANGAPAYKAIDGNVVAHTPDGNPVELGPQEYTGRDENGNPLGPYDPNNATTAAKAPLKSNAIPGTDDDKKTPYDWAETANYGTDAAKFAVGMIGAQTPLPNWTIPGEWTDYANRMKYQSNEGLGGADKALAQTGADNTYLTALERNRSIGGGNAGTIIAADNIANVAHNNAAVRLAAADHDAHLQNLSAYGPVVQQDIRNSRTQYQDEYDRAMLTKQSGAALANKAQDDAANQMQIDKYYGPDSDYAKLMALELQQKKGAVDAQTSGNNVNYNREATYSNPKSTGNPELDNYIAAFKYSANPANKGKKLYTQNADGTYAAINQ